LGTLKNKINQTRQEVLGGSGSQNTSSHSTAIKPSGDNNGDAFQFKDPFKGGSSQFKCEPKTLKTGFIFDKMGLAMNVSSEQLVLSASWDFNVLQMNDKTLYVSTDIKYAIDLDRHPIDALSAAMASVFGASTNVASKLSEEKDKLTNEVKDIEDKLKTMNSDVTTELENKQKELNAKHDQIKNKIVSASDGIFNEVKPQIDKARSEIENAENKLQNSIKEIEQKLNSEAGKSMEEFRTKNNEIEPEVKQVLQSLETARGKFETELNDVIAKVDAEVTGVDKIIESKMNEQLNTLETEKEQVLNEMKSVQQNIAESFDGERQKLLEQKENLQNKLQGLQSDISGAAQDGLEKIKEIKNQLQEAGNILNSFGGPGKVNEANIERKKAEKDPTRDRLDKLSKKYEGYQKSIENKLKTKWDRIKEERKAKVEECKQAVEKAKKVEKATNEYVNYLIGNFEINYNKKLEEEKEKIKKSGASDISEQLEKKEKEFKEQHDDKLNEYKETDNNYKTAQSNVAKKEEEKKQAVLELEKAKFELDKVDFDHTDDKRDRILALKQLLNGERGDQAQDYDENTIRIKPEKANAWLRDFFDPNTIEEKWDKSKNVGDESETQIELEMKYPEKN
jgi:chromosome segregation ATPase